MAEAGADMLLSVGRVFTKTNDYLEYFARFKKKENIEAVERQLSQRTELAFFERSQLGMSLWLGNFRATKC